MPVNMCKDVYGHVFGHVCRHAVEQAIDRLVAELRHKRTTVYEMLDSLDRDQDGTLRFDRMFDRMFDRECFCAAAMS